MTLRNKESLQNHRKQLKSNIFPACFSCATKKRSYPGVVFFKDAIEEKEKAWRAEKKAMKVLLSLTQAELSEALSSTTNIKEKRIEALLEDIEILRSDRLNVALKGFTEEGRIKAIEDLIKM